MSAIKRPVQIEEFTVALRDIADEELLTIKTELVQSISKLFKTNNRLKKLIGEETQGTPSADDAGSDEDEYYDVSKEDTSLFNEIVFENEVVAKNQKQRVRAIENELSFRGIQFEKFADTAVGSAA